MQSTKRKEKGNPESDRRAADSARGIRQHGKTGVEGRGLGTLRECTDTKQDVYNAQVDTVCIPTRSQHSLAEIKHINGEPILSLRRRAASPGPRCRQLGQPGECRDEGLFAEDEEGRGRRARQPFPASAQSSAVRAREGLPGAGTQIEFTRRIYSVN